jgi:hypothetical protein
MIDSLSGFSMTERTRSSTQERVYADASNSTENITHKASESASPDIDIAAHIENFMWRQMCIIKQQSQALEALSISAEKDDIPTVYSKLGRSYAALLPMRPLLDGLIAVMIQRDLPADDFRQQLSALDEGLESIKTQMYKLIYEHNDIGFVRSSPDQETERYIAMVQQDAEGFVHVKLDRQQAMEDLIETEDGVEMLEDKLNAQEDEHPVDFSVQLQAQTAVLELHVDRLLEERSATTVPIPPRNTEERSAVVIPTPLRKPELLQEQETPAEGLLLVTEPPIHAIEDKRNVQTTSLLFSGDYEGTMRRRDFSDDPPIIDLTWTSPRPSPIKVVSTLNNHRECY